MNMNFYRSKLLNALLYFSKNTKHANTTKVCKLLYYFDFEHFVQAGFPSIGLQYYAFQRGPVPKSFWLEIKDGVVPEDFRGKLGLLVKDNESDPEKREIEFKAIEKPDMSFFSPREKKILEKIAFIFSESSAKEISDISHLKNKPWDLTKRTKGLNAPIDYLHAIDTSSELSVEEAKELLEEFFETIKNFSLHPTNDPR
jgi:uncharacterized phage-associated protein